MSRFFALLGFIALTQGVAFLIRIHSYDQAAASALTLIILVCATDWTAHQR